MRVSDTLDTGAILTGARFIRLEDVIQRLISMLVTCGRLPAPLADRAFTTVTERERLSSTAMVDIGVSIPHSRLEGLTNSISALAVSPTAIYGATEGTPISIVALVLSPPELSSEHLNLLSALSLLLHSTPLRRHIQTAPSAEAALKLIRANER